MSFIFFSSVLYVVFSAVPEGYVVTPHGLRPSDCVKTPEEYNHILYPSNDNSGTWIYYPDSDRRVFHPALSHCVENAQKIKKKLTKKRNKLLKSKLKNNHIVKKSSKLSAHNKYSDDDGWQIYTGFDAPSGYFESFTALHDIPDDDFRAGNQILYYFIGMENFVTSQELTIIQPVMTYCEDGCNDTETGSSIEGWSAAPWNCCPDGMSWYNDAIPLEKGDEGVRGTIYTDPSDSDAFINVTVSFNGDESVLYISGDDYSYNWADVTLEAYDFSSCNEFNSDPLIFYDMELTSYDDGLLDDIDWYYINYYDICDHSMSCQDDGLECEIIGNGQSDVDENLARSIMKYKAFGALL